MLRTAPKGKEGADQAAGGAQDRAAQPARRQGDRRRSLEAVQDVSFVAAATPTNNITCKPSSCVCVDVLIIMSTCSP